jgi:cytochrome c oxidase accessory protein FixG
MKDDSFRDSIATVNEDGSRNFIFPKKPKGWYYNARTYVSYFLLAILFSGPFIKINGNPILMFNIFEREFSLFGSMFYPHDFYIFVLMMITGIVFIVLFTVVFGRLFCGWVCPQTIFLEMVFRKIEYITDGDRYQQMKLDRMPWNGEKIRKRLIKWSIFAVLSTLIAHTFLAYIIGIDNLLILVQSNPMENMTGFGALVIFTALFFYVFTSFREQACLIACPYGRLQGVLLDRKSIQVSYDYVRGEREQGRSKYRKGEDRKALGKGDCIDCNQCVEVCPTGIDIRNGSQLECVNCTACMDACNSVMTSINLPTGLIRYASEENIANGEKPTVNARIIGYTAVLTILITVVASLLLLRADVETTLLRLPGQLYQTDDSGNISNVYTYKMINKTNLDKNLELKVLTHSGVIELVGNPQITVKARGRLEGTIFVRIPKQEVKGQNEKLIIGVFENDELISEEKTNFIGPMSFK